MLHRGVGSTRSERLLVQWAERSFLRLWTYPNLFRDQGDGKEICDVVVVFDDNVILISDKEIAFPPGKTDVAWKRWKRRAVLGSANQLLGDVAITNRPSGVIAIYSKLPWLTTLTM